MKLKLEIELLSPLHLGSGKGDVVIDAEIVHDEYGLPYFPAKRIKGLLYESALELIEMGRLSGMNIVDKAAVENLFGKKETGAELFVHDFVLQDYANLRDSWGYILTKYNGLISNTDVLESYTSTRFQTKIEQEKGVAADGSLHNMRVLDAGHKFTGEVEITSNEEKYIKVIVLAAANLRYAGAKRNRGFGEIKCSVVDQDKRYTVEKLMGGK